MVFLVNLQLANTFHISYLQKLLNLVCLQLSNVRAASAGTIAAVGLSTEGRAVLERQEGLLQSLVTLVVEGCSSPAAEAAACSLMNIAASQSGKVGHDAAAFPRFLFDGLHTTG